MIRIANINDQEKIVEFNYLLAKETENLELNRPRLLEGVKAILNEPNKGNYYLYVKNEKIVGQLMITLEWSDWRNAYFVWIQSVYVDKEHRKNKVFHSLYNHVKTMVSQDSKYCGIRLYVDHNNQIAQTTYNNLGMNHSNYIFYEWQK